MLTDAKSTEPVVGQTLCSEQVGRTLLLVHAARPVNTGEWRDHCHQLVALRPAGMLVFAPPGCPGPDADQRRQGSEAFERSGRPPVAIVTRSALHRHVITAFNWITGGAMRGFSPADLDGALAYAAVQARADVLTTAARMSRQMGVERAFPELQ